MRIHVSADALCDLLRQLGASAEGAQVSKSALALLMVDPAIDSYRPPLENSLLEFIEETQLAIVGTGSFDSMVRTGTNLVQTLKRVIDFYSMTGEAERSARIADFSRVVQRTTQWV